MKEIGKITSQIRKGALDFVILSALKSEPKYPRQILEELSELDLDIVEGTIYPLFLRLYKNGLVDYEWQEAGGHPRKYYSLTKQGHQAFEQYKIEWDKLNIVLKSINES